MADEEKKPETQTGKSETESSTNPTPPNGVEDEPIRTGGALKKVLIALLILGVGLGGGYWICKSLDNHTSPKNLVEKPVSQEDVLVEKTERINEVARRLPLPSQMRSEIINGTNSITSSINRDEDGPIQVNMMNVGNGATNSQVTVNANRYYNTFLGEEKKKNWWDGRTADYSVEIKPGDTKKVTVPPEGYLEVLCPEGTNVLINEKLRLQDWRKRVGEHNMTGMRGMPEDESDGYGTMWLENISSHSITITLIGVPSSEM